MLQSLPKTSLYKCVPCIYVIYTILLEGFWSWNELILLHKNKFAFKIMLLSCSSQKE